MSIAYSIVTDWAFYRTAFRRYRQQHPNRRRAILLAVIVALALLLAWIYGEISSAPWTPIPACFLIGGSIGGVAAYLLGKTVLPWRIRRSPGFGETVTVTLDDDGLHAAEPVARIDLAWQAFTRVVRFRDGILFLRGRVIRWLPDSALQNATPGDALAFVRSKTQVVDAG